MAQVNLDNALESRRDAVRRHARRESFELLTAADRGGGRSPEDLEALAEAAWWNGRSDRCISARERAAAAQGGEVLASWHTAQPCKFALSEPREVTLKGIAQPVQVVSVSWR